MVIRLGFHERLTIRSDTSAAGDPEPDYTGTAFATGVPARVISVRGAETFRGRQLEASVDYVVEMQYLAGLLPTMRIEVESGSHSGENLNIEFVKLLPLNSGRAEKLELHCRQVV